MSNAGFVGLSILIVEDEPLLRKRLAARLEYLGADVTSAATLQAARTLLQQLDYDFVLLDVNLPDGRGTDLLKDRAFPASTGVIVMTAQGAVAGAVEAMKLGALDYLVKPFDAAELPVVLQQARRARQAARRDEHRRQEAAPPLYFGQALADLQAQLQKILAADQRMQKTLPPVLIEGETGTGKTSMARWLHQQGPRAGSELVEVNCSTLPEALAESELFGHERGAFTDARTARMGLFEAADGGTLLLDELPSLSLPLQAKILTAIEDHKIRRVGSNKTITIDVRLVAASNRTLKQLVEQGQFRQDLYHRLDLFRIVIPPLRQWGQDIPELARQLLQRICQRHRVPARKIGSLGLQRLLACAWPGNVRELAHELERAVVFEEQQELTFAHLAVTTAHPHTQPDGSPPDWLNPSFNFEGFSLETAIDRLIKLALDHTGGNVSAAARLLSVQRDYIRYRLGLKTQRNPASNRPVAPDNPEP